MLSGMLTGKPDTFEGEFRLQDVTESKRIRENMHYYISQIARPQEEEQKFTACELHDETIQTLVLFYR